MRPDADAPTVTHQDRFAADLAEQRRATDERTKRDRLDAAVRAVEVLGLRHTARALSEQPADWLDEARLQVRGTRTALLDGSDEPRFRACNLALQALGALWAVS